jgi:hypothetical protein
MGHAIDFKFKVPVNFKYLLGMMHQYLSGLSQLYFGAISFEKLGIQLIFQLMNVLGDRRLANKQFRRGFGEIEPFGNRMKNLQPKIENHGAD